MPVDGVIIHANMEILTATCALCYVWFLFTVPARLARTDCLAGEQCNLVSSERHKPFLLAACRDVRQCRAGGLGMFEARLSHPSFKVLFSKMKPNTAHPFQILTTNVPNMSVMMTRALASTRGYTS